VLFDYAVKKKNDITFTLVLAVSNSLTNSFFSHWCS